MISFKELSTLLVQCKSLVLIVTQQGDQITVVTQPTPNENSPSGLRNQLCLTGTAEELDAEFMNAISHHASQLKSIGAQVAENAAQMEAEKKRLADEVADKRSKSTKAPAVSASPKQSADTGGDDVGNDDDNDNDDDDTQSAITEPTMTSEGSTASQSVTELF